MTIESIDEIINNIRNHCRTKKKETSNDKTIGNIRNIFRYEEHDSYKLTGVGSFYSNNYIEY